MFAKLTQRLRDAKTLASLCTAAEQVARRSGKTRPGSEHFVLAAIDLQDGTARGTFAKLGIDAARFQAALQAQAAEALRSVGVVVQAATVDAADTAPPLPDAPALYQAEASAQVLMQRLAESRAARATRGLLSADVLLAAAQEQHSATGRALRSLGITPQRLEAAARQALDRA